MKKQKQKRDPFQRARHARYFEGGGVVYHIIFKTIQGFFLLTPDEEGELRRLIAGIIGHARKTCAGVKNHATIVLSNHGHMMISGAADEMAAYVGFFKRELSRRWGPRIGWQGIFSEGYEATALVTEKAQRRCLKYVLSQTVKEGLVETPAQWPGFHCAESLVTGEAIFGEWLDGTKYGKTKRREERKRNPQPISKSRFIQEHHVQFDKLPTLAHMSDEAYRKEVAAMVDEIVAEGRERRAGVAPLGPVAITKTDPMKRRGPPVPPWFEDRRHMVLWENLREPEVEAYLKRYWDFQVAFREAADLWREGDLSVAFPAGAFRPGLSKPVPHAEARAA